MKLREKAKVMDAGQIESAIVRIAHEIIENNKSVEGLAIVGIRTRGALLADRLAGKMGAIVDREIPVGALDITLYRDDLTDVAEQPVVHKTEIDFDIHDKVIILVDDVLYTGRTIRCALDALIDFGRPKSIQLAVLVDRGHRELPIRADYAGKNIPTSQKETVQVKMKEADGEDGVKYSPKDKKVHDVFELRASIPKTANIILNPIHDRMTRFEMKLKRQFLSENNRWVVSVWNKGKKDRNGRSKDGKGPAWTIFYDGEEIVVTPIENQLGVEIGVLSIV